jgi:hypothetical protein
MTSLSALWRGELPLAEAFWTWTVAIGLVVNIATSLLFIAFVMLDRPWVALILGYGASIPYNVAAVAGVWRSAARHPGPTLHADLARAASLSFMIALSLT